MHELGEICEWVRTQAVPRLVTGMDPIGPALPARYEIAVGHEDERQAIAAGTAETALERHGKRLGAAAAREGLLETIGRMGSPHAEQIAAWLAHLTDEEVIERLSRVSGLRSQDPEVVLRSLRILEGLRDEALEFAQTP